jgi:SAM-dependent methyltransferase
MHDTAMAAGAAFFSTYFPAATPRILDIGALDVNGSLRSVAPPGSDYVGVDLGPGPGVDVVQQPGQALPFPPGSFDACVSVSCFEHDDAFWDTFCQMVEVVRPGGYVLIVAPSNGPYHAYPKDIWRFYADAGLALVTWAQRQGHAVDLIESGILRRRGVVWNDFVGVFQKHPVAADGRGRFLLEAFPDAMNIRRRGSTELAAFEESTEDALLLDQARAEARRLAAELDAQRPGPAAEIDALKRQLAARDAQLRELEDRLQAVLDTRSWRLTRPFRAALRVLRPGAR